MTGTLGREVISTRQRKIAELARREPKLTLTTLAHHIDSVWMREAYRRTRKDAAAGVDGVTAAHYEAELEANLTSLLERLKSGRYRAPAVRRVHLEKPGTNKGTDQNATIHLYTHERACPEARSARGRGVSNNARAWQRPWISAVSARADSRAA